MNYWVFSYTDIQDFCGLIFVRYTQPSRNQANWIGIKSWINLM